MINLFKKQFNVIPSSILHLLKYFYLTDSLKYFYLTDSFTDADELYLLLSH